MTESCYWNCPECGAENALADKECTACGLIVPRAQRVPTQPAAAPAPESAPDSESKSEAPARPSRRSDTSSRRAAGERSGSRRSGRTGRGREAEESGNNKTRNLIVAGVAVVVLGLGGWWLLRTPSFEERLDDLVATWNEGGEGRFDSFAEGQNWGKFDWEMARRGWIADPPAMTVKQTETKELSGVESTIVLVDLDGAGSMKVVWRNKKKLGWVPIDWTFPDIAGEPGEATTARLKEAWNAEGTAAFADLFTEEYRNRMAGKIVRSLERRGWVEKRPEIDSVRYQRKRSPMTPMVEFIRSGDFEAQVGVGRAGMDVSWEYHHPDWKISKITFKSR